MKFFLSIADTTEAMERADHLARQYDIVDDPDASDAIIALGGDGQFLKTLHQNLGRGNPVFGMNCGSVGFLMNEFAIDGLEERIKNARHVELNPLRMEAHTPEGETKTEYAINEVSLSRSTLQAAKIRIIINGVVRLPELICDGALVATPIGSTAYNLSAHGPILPLRSRSLALTPVSAFRPRRWRGAILEHDTTVHIDILERLKRPVYVAADSHVVHEIESVTIQEDPEKPMLMLFDPEYSLEERVIKEQFQT